MRKLGRRIDCQVRMYDDGSCECWICDEDEWCLYRRRWVDRAQALADVEAQRRALAGDGWTTDG
jgi:hypothetical protein